MRSWLAMIAFVSLVCTGLGPLAAQESGPGADQERPPQTEERRDLERLFNELTRLEAERLASEGGRSIDPGVLSRLVPPTRGESGLSPDELVLEIVRLQKAIYGTDDRRDVFATTGRVRENSRAVAVMVHRGALRDLGDGGAWELSVQDRSEFPGTAFGLPLCSSVPFRDDRVPVREVGERVWPASHCTVFLVGRQTVATAGHCVDERVLASRGYELEDFAFLFGFEKTAADLMPNVFRNMDVYFPTRVVRSEYNPDDKSQLDYSLIRLDRPVTGREPVEMQSPLEEVPEPGDELYMIGHPEGLPMKFAGGSKVLDRWGAKFRASLDAFHVNSGSPVFNLEHAVVGILSGGAADHQLLTGALCEVEFICSDRACEGENVTPAVDAHLALDRSALIDASSAIGTLTGRIDAQAVSFNSSWRYTSLSNGTQRVNVGLTRQVLKFESVFAHTVGDVFTWRGGPGCEEISYTLHAGKKYRAYYPTSGPRCSRLRSVD